jgi:hypothetical protein
VIRGIEESVGSVGSVEIEGILVIRETMARREIREIREMLESAGQRDLAAHRVNKVRLALRVLLGHRALRVLRHNRPRVTATVTVL